MQVLAQGLYGYGYSWPYQNSYKAPRVECGLKDYEDVLKEFEFLDNPDSSVDNSVYSYYVTEFSHQAKLKLYCLVSFKLK